MKAAPEPRNPCIVTLRNHTELPVTAVAFKFLLASELAPGEDSSPTRCPAGEAIEFQFAGPGTPHEQIEWSVQEFSLHRGASYRIVISGSADQREFEVYDTSLA